jgi:hypothetical protein
MTTPLIVYGSNVASGTLSTAGSLSTTTGGSETHSVTTAPSSGIHHFLELCAITQTPGDFVSLPNPTGKGWLLDTTVLEGQTIPAGNWSGVINIADELTGTWTASTITQRYWKRSSGGTYTAIGQIQLVNQAMNGGGTKQQFSFPATGMSLMAFVVGDKLYIDQFIQPSTADGNWSSDRLDCWESNSASVGVVNDTVITTPGFDSAANPILATAPGALTFNDVTGGTNPAPQTSTLSETAGVATAWTSSVAYGAGWGDTPRILGGTIVPMGSSPMAGSLGAFGTQVVTFALLTGGLAAATYTATITFTATTGGAAATVVVTLVITAPLPPTLATSPPSLSFFDLVGGPGPAMRTSVLSETGGTGSDWTSSIVYGAGWNQVPRILGGTILELAINPPSGTLSGLGTQSITFDVTTGYLPVGVYSALVTFTATTGGSIATVAITFAVNPLPPPPPPPNTIFLQGQNITAFCDQMSVVVDDTLGQGGGAGSSSSTQGRAATIRFNTNLGPMNRAIGAGQKIPAGLPSLVRQGEIVITDPSGVVVFGGYATKYTDTTTSILGQTTQNFTTVEGIDYSTSLQRTLVNETFAAQTDIQIIKFVMQKYAPWVKLDFLPLFASYLFPIKSFRNVTLEVVLQTVAGITGFLVYVDYHKFLRYIAPTEASSAPFSLTSTPDFVHSFPHSVSEFLVDDNSAINRIFFYGGTKISNNFWQDLSPMVNGNNKVFTLAFNPLVMVDGKFHVQLGGSNGVGGAEQIVGTSNSSGVSNQLISQGGTAQVLLDQNARSLTFDTAPSGVGVFAGYRYSFPLSIIMTDEVSHKFFGDPYLDGFIDDSTIFDTTTAIQRIKVVLAQQSFGLVSLKVDTYQPGIQAGMLLQVVNPLRGINGTYLVQRVQIETYGGGQYVFHIDLGAWNWNLIDFLLKLPSLSAFQDDQSNETTETVILLPNAVNARIHDAWAHKTSSGPYYARAAQLASVTAVPRILGGTLEGANFDGHAAFCGLATISS